MSADDREFVRIDPFYLARSSAAKALHDFVDDREYKLTYTQGAPLRDAAEAADVPHKAAHDDGHEDAARVVANSLDDWLDDYGDDVPFAYGEIIAEVRDTLLEGEEFR